MRFLCFLTVMAVSAIAGAANLAASGCPDGGAAAPGRLTKRESGGGEWEGFRAKIGGSASVLYTHVTSQEANANPVLTNRNANPEDGFLGEFALFARVEASEKTSGHFRLCYGCHQGRPEVESAYFRYEFSEALSFRGGRFSLPLGGINARHDQTTRHLISKPLPQAMGNVVRAREFNQGVIPAPTVDNGIAAALDVDVALLRFRAEVFAVSGFKGFATDLDMIGSRNYEDNNREPAAGGRVELSSNYWSIGVSGMAGNYDPDGVLSYQVATLDLSLTLGDLSIEGFYAQRRTEYMDPVNGQTRHWKRGYFVQAAYALVDDLHVVLAGDGMFMTDVGLATFGPIAGPGAVTDRSNQVNRVTAGLSYSMDSNLQLKLTGAMYDFSDFRDASEFQLALAWSF